MTSLEIQFKYLSEIQPSCFRWLCIKYVCNCPSYLPAICSSKHLKSCQANVTGNQVSLNGLPYPQQITSHYNKSNVPGHNIQAYKILEL
jgi:hypothetical protein